MDFYNKWSVHYKSASISMVNREELMEKVAVQIENNFTLIGATAIEDKL